MLFFLRRRRKRKRRNVVPADDRTHGVYSLPKKEGDFMPLHEMDQDTARPAELGGGGMFEMDSRQVSVSELGDGRRE